jgi:diketogulonate reductase-like aldo/keto reductase
LTLLDTAENYGNGASETLVGLAIRDIREKVQIASKFSPENSEYGSVIKSAENSLKRLKTDYIDLYQVHWPNPTIPMSETFSALNKLKEQEKIRAIGVCNFSKSELEHAIKITGDGVIVSNQVEYNLLDRYIELEILPFCIKNKIKVLAYSPLDKGRIFPNEKSKIILSRLSNKLNKTPSQILLSWITKGNHCIAIPKSGSISHLEINSGSLSLDLTKSDQDLISENCRVPIDLITPNKINVSEFGEESRKVYRTLQEAEKNHLVLCPSPTQLAMQLRNGENIKPVRIIRAQSSTTNCTFDLIEGRLRYWAWVIAFGENRPIPCYVRETQI